MEFEIGIYDDLTYEEYASIPAYRSHDLTSAIKCPYTWKNAKPLEQSPALLEGRVQHTVFLEHHKFNDEFVIQPPMDRRTKVGKEMYEDFIATVGNKTVITQDLYDLCMERRKIVEDFVPKETDKVESSLVFMWHDQPFNVEWIGTTAMMFGISKHAGTHHPEDSNKQLIILSTTCRPLCI